MKLFFSAHSKVEKYKFELKKYTSRWSRLLVNTCNGYSIFHKHKILNLVNSGVVLHWLYIIMAFIDLLLFYTLIFVTTLTFHGLILASD